MEVGFWLSREKALRTSSAVVSFTTSLMVLLSVFCFAISITKRDMAIPLDGPRNLDSSVSLNLMSPAPLAILSASGEFSTSFPTRSSSRLSFRIRSRNCTM